MVRDYEAAAVRDLHRRMRAGQAPAEPAGMLALAPGLVLADGHVSSGQPSSLTNCAPLPSIASEKPHSVPHAPWSWGGLAAGLPDRALARISVTRLRNAWLLNPSCVRPFYMAVHAARAWHLFRRPPARRRSRRAIDRSERKVAHGDVSAHGLRAGKSVYETPTQRAGDQARDWMTLASGRVLVHVGRAMAPSS